MINRIWIILILGGIIISLFTGEINFLGKIILTSGSQAFDMFIKIATMLIFWSGILQIALDAGMIDFFAKILRKPLKALFPEVPDNNKALEYIAGNMVANLLGLGAASTPLGLKAMQELQKLNPTPDTTTRSMTTFILLNASSLTIFPTSIFSLRAMYGANDSLDLMLLMSLTSAISTLIALTLDRLFYRFSKRGKV